MTQPTTPETTGSVRPGKSSGKSTELTLIVPIKPGGAKRLREEVLPHVDTAVTDRVGTLHEARLIIFDNDTRVLFASTFDGSWDQYIDDFGGEIASNLDAMFQDTEGYPGMRSPEIKDWVLKYQVESELFYTRIPEATANQLKKGQRVLNAWEEMLDATG